MTLVSAADIQPLEATVVAWLVKAEIAENTRVSYRDRLLQLLKHAKKGAVISELRSVVERMRADYQARGHGPSFNRARAAVLAFLRDTLGRHSAIYQQTASVRQLNGKRHREGNALSIQDALRLRDELPPLVAKVFWTMCVTGMGLKEIAICTFAPFQYVEVGHNRS